MDLKDLRQRFMCALCEQIYKNVKFLPQCGHSFCEDCLRSYLLQQVRVNGHSISDFDSGKIPDFKPRETTFLCPHTDCKSENKPYDPSKNVSQWVYQCNNDLHIQTVLELAENGDPARAWLCHKCLDASLSVTATHVCLNHMRLYCSVCGFIHASLFKKNSYCRAQTFAISDVEGCLVRKPNSKSHREQASGKSEPKPGFCRLHRLWKVERFCSNCNVDCCTKCIEKSHSMCQPFVSMFHPHTSSVVARLKEKLDKIRTDLNELCSGHLKQLEHMEATFPDCLSESEDSSELSSPRSKNVSNDTEDRDSEKKTLSDDTDAKNDDSELKNSSSESNDEMLGAEASMTKCPPNCKCDICVKVVEVETLLSKLKMTKARDDFLKTHVEKLLDAYENMSAVTGETIHRMDRDVATIESEVNRKMKLRYNEEKTTQLAIYSYLKASMQPNDTERY